MNERYSEEVKSILEAAQQQAVINYNQELTCAHLLVALAGSEGFFPFLLKNAGADATPCAENTFRKRAGQRAYDEYRRSPRAGYCSAERRAGRS